MSDRSSSLHGSPEKGCSVELWLQSANNREASTILEFYQANPQRQFVIRQVGNSLLQLIKLDSSGLYLMDWEHTFFPDKRLLITVTSDVQGTTLYVDATAVRTTEAFSVSGKDCSGRLTLGVAAVSFNDWNGDIVGIAVYNSRLTEAQVLQHYKTLGIQKRLPPPNPTEHVAALYTFAERSGSIVHNAIVGEPDLHSANISGSRPPLVGESVDRAPIQRH